VLACDWHNMESEVMHRYAGQAAGPLRRLYARRTARQLERVERELLPRCDLHTVVSRREQEALVGRVPGTRVAVVENGVDAAWFAEAAESAPRRRVVFVGSMDYWPNIDAAVYFAREVWPGIRARCRELRFTVVGRAPGPQVTALAALPGVEVTGTVSDVRPFYCEAVAAVVPLRSGGGTRLKIVEAMAAGVPVISTTLGAEGLEAVPGRDFALADSAEDFEKWVAALASCPAEFERFRDRGRDLVNARYDWTRIGGALASLYLTMLEARGRKI
jgi:polysaccharide biosynthesis protein PslH